MNDDELKKLFDSLDDPDSDNIEKSEEDKVSAPSNKSEDSSEKTSKKSSEAKKTEDKKSSEEKNKTSKKETKPVAKPAEKKVEKKQVREPAKINTDVVRPVRVAAPAPQKEETPVFEVIREKIRAFVVKLSEIDIEFKRPKPVVEKVPLKDRVFFENFPISFGWTVAILLMFLLLVSFLCFLFLPQFRVLNFVINGNITLSREELIEESGIVPNSHLFSNVSGDLIDIFKQDYGKIEDRMKAENPYIKDIQINVDFPSTIRMDVTERNKIAYVKMPDGYAAIDEEGIVIELVTIIPDEEAHAVICGLDVSCAVKQKKINIMNESDYQKALLVLGAIINADNMGGDDSEAYQLFANIKEIRIIPGGTIFLTVNMPSGTELHVKLDSVADINEDMEFLRRAIITDTFDGFPDGSFDMTGEEYIYRKYN